MNMPKNGKQNSLICACYQDGYPCHNLKTLQSTSALWDCLLRNRCTLP